VFVALEWGGISSPPSGTFSFIFPFFSGGVACKPQDKQVSVLDMCVGLKHTFASSPMSVTFRLPVLLEVLNREGCPVTSDKYNYLAQWMTNTTCLLHVSQIL